MFKRPELGFVALLSGHLAMTWSAVEGALRWATLVLGVIIGVLTVVRLLVEIGVLRSRKRRYRRLRVRRAGEP